jgi:hypothetical protein
MNTKYDVEFCPCGCGNRRHDSKTNQESVNRMRQMHKDERMCMEEETTFLSVRTLDEIKKHGYRPIETYSLQEFIRDAETEHEKWAMTQMYRDLCTINAMAGSGENRIEK